MVVSGRIKTLNFSDLRIKSNSNTMIQASDIFVVRAIPIIPQGLTENDRYNFTNKTVRETCSFPTNPIPFEHVIVKLEGIKLFAKEEYDEDLYVYFFGEGGEVIPNKIYITKDTNGLEIILSEERRWDFYSIADGRNFKVNRIGFSSTLGKVEFSASAHIMEESDVPRFLHLV